MRYFCIIITALLFNLGAQAQADTLPVRVAGIVFSEDSIQETPYVHIINKRTGRGVIADSMGIFRTKILKHDTLIFTCIGFADYHYVLPDTIESNLCLLSIKLSPTTYDLDVVDVIALSRRSQVKYDIVNMAAPEKTWRQREIIPGIPCSEYLLIRPDEQPLGIQGFSPVSAVYNAFGKNGRSVSKLVELLEQDKIDEVIDDKYNREKLQAFTNYHESKLDCFTMYLNFNPNYLYQENEYFIFSAVKQKMAPFEFTFQSDSLRMLTKLGN